MHMLVRDQEIFVRRFPDAVAFITAASLRLEVYGLVRFYLMEVVEFYVDDQKYKP